MKRLIIDGNAVYEIDEECMRKKQKVSRNETENSGNTEMTAKRQTDKSECI